MCASTGIIRYYFIAMDTCCLVAMEAQYWFSMETHYFLPCKHIP